ncbi:PAS domain-containing protein [Lyngbya aestuarii]|uniref:PAS domain-containing protein n=1 Tax=Lyngbya aestuarii TaxID=118322 RepID=UPI00403D8BC1
MKINQMLHKIETLQQQVDLISRNSNQLLLEPELLSAVLEELSIAVEELQIQQEEMSITYQEMLLECQDYQALFEEAPEAYLVTDILGVIQKTNQAGTKILNLPREFLVGKPLVIFVAETSHQDFYGKLTQLQQFPQLQNWQLLLQPRDSNSFLAKISISPIKDSHDTLIGLRWLIMDTRLEALAIGNLS